MGSGWTQAMHGNGTFELNRSLLVALAGAPWGLTPEAMARSVADHDPRLIGWAVCELQSAGLIEPVSAGFFRITANGAERAEGGWPARRR